MNLNKSLILISLTLLLIGNLSFSQEKHFTREIQDTILLKNFWINPKYYHGEKRIYVKDFKSIIKDVPIALTQLKKGKRLRVIGYSMAAIGGGFIGAGLPNSYSEVNSDLIITGSIIAGCAFIVDYFAKTKFRDAIRIYNGSFRKNDLDQDASLKVKIGFSLDRLCLNISF